LRDTGFPAGGGGFHEAFGADRGGGGFGVEPADSVGEFGALGEGKQSFFEKKDQKAFGC
jgi:hypothetical protein